MNAKLLADPDYASASDASRDLVDGFELDEIMRLVHGEIDRPAQVGEFTVGISAEVVTGRGQEAQAFAVDIAEACRESPGSPPWWRRTRTER